VKAARDYMVARRGITAPEMVVGPSAHAAYWKAAEYFNIKLVIAPLGRDLRCAHRLPFHAPWRVVLWNSGSGVVKHLHALAFFSWWVP
jgi:hypothetical protein